MGVEEKPVYRFDAERGTFTIGSDTFLLSVAQYRLMKVLTERPHQTVRPTVLADLASTAHGNLSGNMSRIMALLREEGYENWVVHRHSEGYRFVPYGEEIEPPPIRDVLAQLTDLDETGKASSLLSEGYPPVEVADALSLPLSYVRAIEAYSKTNKTRGLNGPLVTLPPLLSLHLE